MDGPRKEHYTDGLDETREYIEKLRREYEYSMKKTPKSLEEYYFEPSRTGGTSTAPPPPAMPMPSVYVVDPDEIRRIVREEIERALHIITEESK